MRPPSRDNLHWSSSMLYSDSVFLWCSNTSREDGRYLLRTLISVSRSLSSCGISTRWLDLPLMPVWYESLWASVVVGSEIVSALLKLAWCFGDNCYKTTRASRRHWAKVLYIVQGWVLNKVIYKHDAKGLSFWSNCHFCYSILLKINHDARFWSNSEWMHVQQVSWFCEFQFGQEWL